MGRDESREDSLFVRSAYYPGKLLHAGDFITDQEYGNRKLAFIIRNLHGWGILEGLEAEETPDGSVRLLRGSAIDPRGRILSVPADRRVEAQDIEGIFGTDSRELILGLRYAERTVETERVLLQDQQCVQPAKIAETCVLKAYGEIAWERLLAQRNVGEELLVQEKVLYKGEGITLSVRVPRIVPADGLFRIRILMCAQQEVDTSVGWRGIAKLEGAFCARTGNSFFRLEEEQVVCSGRLEREWEICTEERRQPVLLEISSLEITDGKGQTVEAPACRLCMETAADYDRTVRRYLRGRLPDRQEEAREEWVPLARLRLEEAGQPGGYKLTLPRDDSVRVTVARPLEEQILARVRRENGIFDRGLQRRPEPPRPAPEPVHPLPPPGPGQTSFPPPPEGGMLRQQMQELLEEDREKHMRRGVAVITIPKRCRKGQVIVSDKIFHGFRGEEVLLWCGRMLEEQYRVYWERGRKQYQVLSGDQGLFSEERDSPGILRQAVLQNVEEGSFRIALTVSGRKGRSRSREVAVSWAAIKLE